MRTLFMALALSAALYGQPASAYAPSPDEKHQKELEADAKQGAEYAEIVRKEYKTSENIDMIERVTRLGNKIAETANKSVVTVKWGDKRLNPFTYEFTVLQGDEVNAFSLPGGHIYVFEGLVNFAETDEELEGVLAHEVAHAAFRHIATLRREQSKMDIINIPLIIAAILAGGSDSANIAQGVGLLGQASMSGWSVKAEEAADFGALQYMVATGRNPVALLTFMERLAFRDRSLPKVDWGIYQTHPPSNERARAFMAHLNQWNVPIRRSEVTRSFRAVAKPADSGAIELWFGGTKLYEFNGNESLTEADTAVLATNRFLDTVPQMYELSASPDGKVYGDGRLLFKIDGDETAIQAVLSKFKKIVFDLQYRLWPAHDLATERG